MKKYIYYVIFLFAYLLFIGACKKEDSEINKPLPFVIPTNFPKANYQFEQNPITQKGFALGRKLFYDPALSLDNSVSCGSCHQQFAAFANLDHRVSHGINHCNGTRNAPPIFNLAWIKDFMWDGGVHHIEVSGLNAITNPCEMGSTLAHLTQKLSNNPSYPLLFKQVFGTSEINSQRILKALTQFTGSMISATSKYDKVMRKEKDVNFTSDELEGYTLFKQKCGTCHKEPLFTNGEFASNGLDEYPVDIGRDSITQNPLDRGKFRIPTLRNIEFTKPYMHDGRFNTIEQVLKHYANGVKNHQNLDNRLKQEENLGISLSKEQQNLIITFLKTLSDHEFINDKRFSETL